MGSEGWGHWLGTSICTDEVGQIGVVPSGAKVIIPEDAAYWLKLEEILRRKVAWRVDLIGTSTELGTMPL